MKIIRVTYTAKPEYVEQNQANIKNVMADLQKIGNPNLNYNVCLSPDGKSFTHTAFFKTDEDNKMLLDLPAFKHFQEQLKANGIETPTKQEVLTFVGSSKDLFNS